MTHGGPGHGYPQQQPGWQPGQYPARQPHPQQYQQPYPQQQYQQPQQFQQHYPQQFQGGQYPPRQYPGPQYPGQQPQQEPPLTLPGWGAIPALIGIVLAVLGVFVLAWVGEAGFIDLRSALASDTDLWLWIYFRRAGFIALGVAAVAPILWSLGVLRSREKIAKRGGLTKSSLLQGRTGPTRALIAAFPALALLYHGVSLVIFTDNGQYLSELGPGPWLLLAGTALSLAGALIGPRVPNRPGLPPH
ncbi:hypothetical protein [Prauserella cavernicola]|uniref:Uncharacterized protein n=1 Tax=Prauserella cavernicola TaxID=2800127 RepID=A0A934V6S2_9PSEU|nr:hypothetical protein [Prauserella cavernicola]MBK1785968.1 hypothetical protein [Prauserella cavernicola]